MLPPSAGAARRRTRASSASCRRSPSPPTPSTAAPSARASAPSSPSTHPRPRRLSSLRSRAIGRHHPSLPSPPPHTQSARRPERPPAASEPSAVLVRASARSSYLVWGFTHVYPRLAMGAARHTSSAAPSPANRDSCRTPAARHPRRLPRRGGSIPAPGRRRDTQEAAQGHAEGCYQRPDNSTRNATRGGAGGPVARARPCRNAARRQPDGADDGPGPGDPRARTGLRRGGARHGL